MSAWLGITFKEDVPDLRNTRVVDILHELADYGIEVLVHDPLADPEEAKAYYNVDLKTLDDLKGVDALVVAVSHQPYRDMGLAQLAGLCGGSRAVMVGCKKCIRSGSGRKAGHQLLAAVIVTCTQALCAGKTVNAASTPDYRYDCPLYHLSGGGRIRFEAACLALTPGRLPVSGNIPRIHRICY